MGSMGHGTGTLEYMAPEILSPRSTEPQRKSSLASEGAKRGKRHTTTTDLWSCGIVLYYLCYSQTPYENVDDVDLLQEEISRVTGVDGAGIGGMIDPSCSARLQGFLSDLIRELCNLDSTQRPDCASVLERIKNFSQ